MKIKLLSAIFMVGISGLLNAAWDNPFKKDILEGIAMGKRSEVEYLASLGDPVAIIRLESYKEEDRELRKQNRLYYKTVLDECVKYFIENLSEISSHESAQKLINEFRFEIQRHVGDKTVINEGLSILHRWPALMEITWCCHNRQSYEVSLHDQTIMQALTILLENGANINIKDCNDKTALYSACQKHNLFLVQFLVNRGANPTLLARRAQLQNEGISPLVIALDNGASSFAQQLIEKGVDVNERLWNNSTALIMLCLEGNFNAARFLLEHGAAVNVFNRRGDTPLSAALRLDDSPQKESLLELLRSKGAILNPKDLTTKETALHKATEEGNYAVVRLILDDIKTRN